MADANYNVIANVIAMINALGNLAERYEYTPYPRMCGRCQVYRYNTGRGARGDMNGDGGK